MTAPTLCPERPVHVEPLSAGPVAQVREVALPGSTAGAPRRPAGRAALRRRVLVGSVVILLAIEAALIGPTLTGAVTSLAGPRRSGSS